ncbi:MAG: hypothetical protein ACRBB4_10680 [Neptuniibacter sp.]
MLNIAAFTFKYDQLEDRLLLVGNFNNQQPRVDFWLTRKLVLRLLSGAQELVDKTEDAVQQAPSDHRSELAQFHHDHAKQIMNAERENQTVTPEDACLLTRLDISYRNDQYRLLFYSNGAEPVAMSVLTYEELHQILFLMHKGALNLDWGVSPNLFNSEFSSQVLQ